MSVTQSAIHQIYRDRYRTLACLNFTEPADGIFAVEVSTRFSRAQVALQGAQVLSFQANDQVPMLWTGEPRSFVAGKAMRAGVPICWPWFSAHPDNPALPSHGFARLVEWSLDAVRELPDGRVSLELSLAPGSGDAQKWSHACHARAIITVGDALEIELITTNHGNAPVTLSQALHTYFQVGDVRQVSVNGLQGKRFFDRATGHDRTLQQGPVAGFEEIERTYIDTPGFCEVVDPLLARRIIVTGTGSRSTVLWNPGADKAAAMGDFGAHGHYKMLCVENANAPLAGDVVTLGPNQSHALRVQYRTICGN